MRLLNWWRRLTAVVTTGVLAGALAGCGGGGSDPNVVEVAQGDPQFSVLAEAVAAADLAGTLSGPGPYTVFAPTDSAFTALLGELGITKAQLLADKTLLRAVLQYHVVAGKVPQSAVPLGKPITPLQGGIFKVDKVGTDLVVTDGRNRQARITATDIMASNGLIHVVDHVLLPANQTLVQTAQARPDFSLLVEAVAAAGLVDTLNGTGPFTVFAPTNDAFARLLAELGVTKDQLFADKALLTRVLTYHVLPARVLKAEVPIGMPITTVQGGSFTVDANLAITDANGRQASITATDVLASNGVIHVIDRVILPKP